MSSIHKSMKRARWSLLRTEQSSKLMDSMLSVSPPVVNTKSIFFEPRMCVLGTTPP
jgi:hypothetical protein